MEMVIWPWRAKLDKVHKFISELGMMEEAFDELAIGLGNFDGILH
jgi:hypothetical protein